MNKTKIILALLVIAGSFSSFKGADKVNIWLIGDSTMAAKKQKDFLNLAGVLNYLITLLKKPKSIIMPPAEEAPKVL